MDEDERKLAEAWNRRYLRLLKRNADELRSLAVVMLVVAACLVGGLVAVLAALALIERV